VDSSFRYLNCPFYTFPLLVPSHLFNFLKKSSQGGRGA
jgi:hypothetical protein